MEPPLRWAARLLLTVLMTCSTGAIAGNFAVTPTNVTLSPERRSALLKLSNRGDEALRYQVTVFRWTQDEHGHMTLTPSQDLVVYPTLLSVPPGESRSLRVGSNTLTGTTELSYRMVVEELPPMESAENAHVGLRMLTRMSFPVFIQPSDRAPSGEIASVSLERGHVTVRVVNTGLVHFKVESVQIDALDGDGRESSSQIVRGWYVLYGDTMEFGADLSPALCQGVRSLNIHAVTDAGTWTRTIEVAGDPCGP